MKGCVCGSGYQFMGDAVLRVDKLNHQVCGWGVGGSKGVEV